MSYIRNAYVILLRRHGAVLFILANQKTLSVYVVIKNSLAIHITVILLRFNTPCLERKFGLVGVERQYQPERFLKICNAEACSGKQLGVTGGGPRVNAIKIGSKRN